MPLFGRSDAPSTPLDRRLLAQLPANDKELRKILEREAAAIAAVLDVDDEVTFLCHSESTHATSVDYYAAIVVTTDSLLVVRKGRTMELFRHEIRDVSKSYDTATDAFLCVAVARTGRCAVHIRDDERARDFVTALGYPLF
jgi:hypothetical protein